MLEKEQLQLYLPTGTTATSALAGQECVSQCVILVQFILKFQKKLAACWWFQSCYPVLERWSNLTNKFSTCSLFSKKSNCHLILKLDYERLIEYLTFRNVLIWRWTSLRFDSIFSLGQLYTVCPFQQGTTMSKTSKVRVFWLPWNCQFIVRL